MASDANEVELRASITESGAIRLRVERSHHPLANFEAELSIDKETDMVDIKSNLEVTHSSRYARSIVHWLRAIIQGYGQGK